MVLLINLGLLASVSLFAASESLSSCIFGASRSASPHCGSLDRSVGPGHGSLRGFQSTGFRLPRSHPRSRALPSPRLMEAMSSLPDGSTVFLTLNGDQVPQDDFRFAGVFFSTLPTNMPSRPFALTCRLCGEGRFPPLRLPIGRVVFQRRVFSKSNQRRDCLSGKPVPSIGPIRTRRRHCWHRRILNPRSSWPPKGRAARSRRHRPSTRGCPSAAGQCAI